MNNWKQYLIILITNLLIGWVFTANCEGETCMIIIFVAFHISVVIISHLPYLFLKSFNKITKNKIFAFIFPSFLMFPIMILTIKIGSNIQLNSHNLIWIGASILPNTILQLILFFINSRNLNEIK